MLQLNFDSSTEHSNKYPLSVEMTNMALSWRSYSTKKCKESHHAKQFRKCMCSCPARLILSQVSQGEFGKTSGMRRLIWSFADSISCDKSRFTWYSSSFRTPLSFRKILIPKSHFQRTFGQLDTKAQVYNEPSHDKTNKMTSVPREDLHQPGDPPSLISLQCPLNR